MKKVKFIGTEVVKLCYDLTYNKSYDVISSVELSNDILFIIINDIGRKSPFILSSGYFTDDTLEYRNDVIDNILT